ncbi:DUF1295 domain-containing protein [Erythrobacter sp. GH1-10]|uniref:DUF1295 domain-containing protein n=1 Tax=Erythrobacter sp. GH1-10 TaxID=3349334 RepID=UPI0038779DAE
MSFEQAPRSLLIAAIAAAIGLGFAYLAGSNSLLFEGRSAFFVCALVALGVNWLAFVPAAIFQSDRFYDSVGALTYISVIAFACFAAWPLDTRALIVAALVAIWTIRLGSFLFMRIHASGGTDRRFAKIKTNPPRFFVAWTLQSLWVIFTASAALIVITSQDTRPLGVFFWAGLVLWLIGFAFEVIADEQKRRFKADPANEGHFIKSGLWAWSQHPNYFGEITLWLGILVIAIPLLSGWSYLAIISPIFVTLLLTKVSGINLLDGIAKKRWGDDPEYREYTSKTPKLIPRPPGS